MLSEKIIPPDGEGEIKVTYSSGKRRGQQSKSIQVLSNDPEKPKVSLKVKGLVKEAVVCEPNRLNFGKVLQGETQTKQVGIKPGEGEKAKVTDVNITTEYLTADLSKKKEEGEELYVVDVTLSPNTPRGRVNGQLKIQTDNENAKEITISVTATITGEVVVSPERLSLYIQKAEQNTGSVLSIEKVKDGELEILSIESDLDYITTSLEPVEKGKRYNVKVNSNPQTVPIGFEKGIITIHTNDANDPRIEVPVNVTVQGNLTVTPDKLRFGSITQSQSSIKTITVTTRKDDLKIKKVKSNIGFLKTEITTLEEGKRFQITVRVDENAPSGQFRETLIIQTNDTLQPEIQISVTGNVRAEPKT